jgi:hypothetical protein
VACICPCVLFIFAQLSRSIRRKRKETRQTSWQHPRRKVYTLDRHSCTTTPKVLSRNYRCFKRAEGGICGIPALSERTFPSLITSQRVTGLISRVTSGLLSFVQWFSLKHRYPNEVYSRAKKDLYSIIKCCLSSFYSQQ